MREQFPSGERARRHLRVRGRQARGTAGAVSRRHPRGDRVVGRPTGGHRLAVGDVKRDQAVNGYLSDTDPGRAAKYGFRSGQNPQLGWSWFRDYPVGFNGVPFVLFKTMLDLDPNHANPTLRASPASGNAKPRCPWDPSGPVRAGPWITSASAPIPPTTRMASRDQPASGSRRCRSALPSRTRASLSRSPRPSSRFRTAGCSRGECFRTPACCSRSSGPRTTRRTGSATGQGSAVRVRWIGCSSRARPATWAASS